MKSIDVPWEGGTGIPPVAKRSPEEAAAAARTVRAIGARLHPGTDAADVVLAALGLDETLRGAL